MNRRGHLDRITRRTIAAGFVALFYGGLCWYPDTMSLLGVGHLGVWFLDTHALLAASDAHALGLNPDGPNPLDFFNQPHVYSHWWFALNFLGLTRIDHVWLGASIGFIFLTVALLQIGVRSAAETAWSVALLIAPPVILGFNRANADLLVFIILAACVRCVLSPHAAWRWVAMAGILLAASLKFYPALAGIVMLVSSRSRRVILAELGVFAVLLGVLGINQAESIRRYWIHQSPPWGLFTFGWNVGAHMLGLSTRISTAAGLMLATAMGVFAWRRAPEWSVPVAKRPEYLRFILGAILLVGCFFATVNYAYRAVFALWLAPFLWSGWSESWWPAWYVRIGRAAALLLVAVLWLDGLLCLALNLSERLNATEALRWSNGLVIAEQPLMMLLMATLLAFVVPFIREGLRALATGATAINTMPPPEAAELPAAP